MKKQHILLSLFSILIITVVISCDKEKKDDDPTTNIFDRKAMLENIGNNIIIPNYLSLQTKIIALETAFFTFNNNPDSVDLVGIQHALKEAYKSWQGCSVFEFGPAEQELFRQSLNTFPADTAQINANISSGTYDLAAASNIDAKGFPALDYLFFGLGNVNAAIAKYTGDISAINRKAYATALITEIKTKTTDVYNQWSSTGGNYINTFSSNTGTDVGSSIGMLVNQINFDWEILRNFRIGIPLGKKTLGTPFPEKVEAYYSQISVELALKHYKAIENLFLGKGESGIDGLGLDDYLTHLNAQHNGGSLTNAIKSQFLVVSSKLETIPDPLSETVLSNPTIVESAYIEIQKMLVLLKTDMPSAMGVLITYQDNDGD